MYTRRQFGKTLAASVGLSMLNVSSLLADPKSDATVRGVKIGAITGAYGPFKAEPGQDVIDVIIQQSIATGAGHVELVNSEVEPHMGGPCAVALGGGRGPGAPDAAGVPGAVPGAGVARGRGGFGPGVFPCGIGGQVPSTYPPGPPGYTEEREKLRHWRLNTPLDRFREIRKKFDDAGLDLFSYVMTIGDDFTDPEIDAVFRQMQALGVDKFCTNTTRVDMGPRIVPYAEKYDIRPAFHTHSQSQDPNEVSSPESLAKLCAMSPLFMVNLDIGGFYGGGNDPLPWLKAHPDRVTHLHVRDADGDHKTVDVGTGALHIEQMLRFVRDNNYNIAFIIEQTGHVGATDNADALKMNIEWAKKILNS